MPAFNYPGFCTCHIYTVENCWIKPSFILDLASVDEAYETIKSLLNNDKKNMWTSIKVEKIYQKHGRSRLSRQYLVGQLTKDITNELIMLSSPGLAY